MCGSVVDDVFDCVCVMVFEVMVMIDFVSVEGVG